SLIRTAEIPEAAPFAISRGYALLSTTAFTPLRDPLPHPLTLVGEGRGEGRQDAKIAHLASEISNMLCLDLFEHRAVRFRDVPAPCPIDNEPLVFRIGQGDRVFFFGDVNQNFHTRLDIP